VYADALLCPNMYSLNQDRFFTAGGFVVVMMSKWYGDEERRYGERLTKPDTVLAPAPPSRSSLSLLEDLAFKACSARQFSFEYMGTTDALLSLYLGLTSKMAGS